MITKTRGIIINHIPYGETSIIARMYTAHYGYQGFLVNSVRSKRSKHSMAYFQPFTFLDLVIYWKSTRDIQRISEYKSVLNWHTDDIKKQTVLLFLGEVVDKLLRNEHTEHPALFDFLTESLTYFKNAKSIENFHLQFLLQLSHHLGIDISSGAELFENMNQVSDRSDVEQFVDALLMADFNAKVDSSGELRFQSLEYLTHYFQHHVSGFGEVRSLKVLKQIFR